MGIYSIALNTHPNNLGRQNASNGSSKNEVQLMDFNEQRECPGCGTVLEEGEVECPSCGVSLEDKDEVL